MKLKTSEEFGYNCTVCQACYNFEHVLLGSSIIIAGTINAHTCNINVLTCTYIQLLYYIKDRSNE